ncbi:hypothetical protein Gromo_00473 [Candidatus Gromoviella agglomerans]|nr:hypothetical protein Gromo_00473 [Candidatus Gromoviella agglomerans]
MMSSFVLIKKLFLFVIKSIIWIDKTLNLLYKSVTVLCFLLEIRNYGYWEV